MCGPIEVGLPTGFCKFCGGAHDILPAYTETKHKPSAVMYACLGSKYCMCFEAHRTCDLAWAMFLLNSYRPRTYRLRVLLNRIFLGTRVG